MPEIAWLCYGAREIIDIINIGAYWVSARPKAVQFNGDLK